MPIVDVELVVTPGPAGAGGRARVLADALGRIFGTSPGRTWVKVRQLAAEAYAENETERAPGELPVFVTVLHARPPEGPARDAEALAVTDAVAAWCGRPPGQVHVQYAPPAVGRQAFGGTLVR